MVFGPYDVGLQVTGSSPKRAAESVIEEAKAAAETLIAELEQARELSANWADQALAYALMQTAMDRCLNRLACTGCWGRENQLPSNELWGIAGSRLQSGSLQERARNKPRGYAGDFEMFVQFMSEECRGDAAGRLFDRYFQEQAAVEAVRSRTQRIAAAIVERRLAAGATSSFRVASIGCGPAIDLELALRWLPETMREDVQLALLDLDEDAIDHASQRLRAFIPADQIAARRENLYRLADRASTLAVFDEADVIVCSGLFDYLPDDAAIRLLSAFWRQLSERGAFLVGNFAPHNPSRAYMEWIGNWYLIYRTPDDLRSLAQAAGIPRSNVTIGAERLGIDLFLCAEKRGSILSSWSRQDE